MAICYYKRQSSIGEEIWGRWVHECLEHMIVSFCRRAFKHKWRNMWIEVVYFDDKYFKHTDEFFSEVGVRLYPKITKIPKRPKHYDTTAWRRYIYSVAHGDISKSIERGVAPTSVVVKGVRFTDKSKKGGFGEKITDITLVKRNAPKINVKPSWLYGGM